MVERVVSGSHDKTFKNGTSPVRLHEDLKRHNWRYCSSDFDSGNHILFLRLMVRKFSQLNGILIQENVYVPACHVYPSRAWFNS